MNYASHTEDHGNIPNLKKDCDSLGESMMLNKVCPILLCLDLVVHNIHSQYYIAYGFHKKNGNHGIHNHEL